MDREKRIQASLTPNVSINKADYINYLLDKIIGYNSTLQHAMESDKFHIVGAQAALMEEAAEDLKVVLDA